MKFTKFIGEHALKIAVIIGIISSIVVSVLLYIDGNKNIDCQIEELYAKDVLVQQDFSNAYTLKGITCYINEDNNVIIFNAKDCSLKATYNKDGILLAKEVEDLRLGSNSLSFAITVVLIFIVTLFLSAMLLLFLSGVSEGIAEIIGKRVKKKQKNKAN